MGGHKEKKTTKKVNWGQVRHVMTKLHTERQRQRDREMDRDRQTDRDRQRDRQRDTDRHRETETKTGKERIMIPFYTRIKI